MEKAIAWLLEQGVYNCLVEIDGKLYRLNRSQGLMQAKAEDKTFFPLLECPYRDELRSHIRAEWLVLDNPDDIL